MLEVGLTTTVGPLRFPGCQVYELAPMAESVALFPGQMVFGVADALTTGKLLTVIKRVAKPVQNPFDPITVYEVLTVGQTTIEAPVEPTLQV